MKKEIQQQRAIELLKEGRSIDYLTQRYSDLSEYTLRALKAHITMGTYDNDKPRKKRTIAKEILLEMILMDIPEELILEKCRVKASTIHAYKAHITRGTYYLRK